MAVPAAAPDAPNLKVKMNKGSRIAFKAVKKKEYTSGVRVSPRPRKIPLLTSHRVAAGVPKARTRKYDTAEYHIGLEDDRPIPRVMEVAKSE